VRRSLPPRKCSAPVSLERCRFVPGVQPLSNDPAELLINSTWRATLAVTGADGLPAVRSAGNVLLPELTLKLSLRLPPTCEPARAAAAVESDAGSAILLTQRR